MPRTIPQSADGQGRYGPQRAQAFHSFSEIGGLEIGGREVDIPAIRIFGDPVLAESTPRNPQDSGGVLLGGIS
jgi:hypothetical protein